MEKFTIYTLQHQGRSLLLDAAKVPEFRPEFVKSWEFECAPYLAESVIEIGRLMNSAALVDGRGLGDAEAISMARAKFVAAVLVKSWNRETDTGGPMPITPETVGTLPVVVLRSLRVLIEQGNYPTDAEIEDMKVPLVTSAPPTAEAA